MDRHSRLVPALNVRAIGLETASATDRSSCEGADFYPAGTVPSPGDCPQNNGADTAYRCARVALSICPICFDTTGALTDGARAGAMVLAAVAALVITAIVRFAARLR
jgi:hypothetical protein